MFRSSAKKGSGTHTRVCTGSFFTPEAKCWYYMCVLFCFQNALCTTQHRTFLAILQTIVVVQMLSLSELNIERFSDCREYALCWRVGVRSTVMPSTITQCVARSLC